MTTADFELRQRPNAMALQSRADSPAQASSAGSSVQTAFQMSLTVLSFLAFGGYVISLVTQNMRKPPQPDGMTVPQPLKTVVVNQQRRPLYHPISGSTMTSVSFGRRKRSRRRRYAWNHRCTVQTTSTLLIGPAQFFRSTRRFQAYNTHAIRLFFYYSN